MELREEIERYFKEVAPSGVATDGEIVRDLDAMYGIGANVEDVRDAANQLIEEGVIHLVTDEETAEERTGRTYEYHDEPGY